MQVCILGWESAWNRICRNAKRLYKMNIYIYIYNPLSTDVLHVGWWGGGGGGGGGGNLKLVIFKLISRIDVLGISCNFWWMPRGPTDWWLINICSGNGLVPSGTTRLNQQSLDRYVGIAVTEQTIFKKRFWCEFWQTCEGLDDLSLTHRGRDKMAADILTTFSNAYSWMKIYVFRLTFHWSLFPRVKFTIFHHWFR